MKSIAELTAAKTKFNFIRCPGECNKTVCRSCGVARENLRLGLKFSAATTQRSYR
jgi:hypothetical protein